MECGQPCHAARLARNSARLFLSPFGSGPRLPDRSEKFRLEVLLAKNNRHEFETAQSFAQNSGAKLVINGGYFSPEYQSLGLIVRNGVPINPKHPTSWWGIFHITDGKPMIDTPNNFKIKPTTTMALQAGPRLLVHGEIPHFKPGIAERSCVGLDAQGRVYIVALTEELWSLERLAQFLALSPEAGGLGLTYALNLDGGSSTQLYANFKGFRLHLPGTKPVANALALFPR